MVFFLWDVVSIQIHLCLDLVAMDTSIALPLGLQFVHLERLPQARILLVTWEVRTKHVFIYCILKYICVNIYIYIHLYIHIQYTVYGNPKK